MGKYEEVLVQLQKGLDVLVSVHGHEHLEHLEVAMTQETMGIIYAHQGAKANTTNRFKSFKSVLEEQTQDPCMRPRLVRYLVERLQAMQRAQHLQT